MDLYVAVNLGDRTERNLSRKVRITGASQSSGLVFAWFMKVLRARLIFTSDRFGVGVVIGIDRKSAYYLKKGIGVVINSTDPNQ